MKIPAAPHPCQLRAFPSVFLIVAILVGFVRDLYILEDSPLVGHTVHANFTRLLSWSRVYGLCLLIPKW